MNDTAVEDIEVRPALNPIPLICSWCDSIIGIVRWDTARACPTHGICPECFERTILKMKSLSIGED
jgi:hypothetical protein